MTKTLNCKRILSVLICVCMVLCVVPASSVSLNAKAEEKPFFNPEYGSYTVTTDSNANVVLTATPKEACGFRGWFDENGNEISFETTLILPKGTDASNYTPVFYNFNLVKNSSFEEYVVGTSLKSDVPDDEIWEGMCDAEINDPNADWTSAVVSDNRAKTGTKSLCVNSYSATTYHDFYNLEANSQYTLKFWYNIDSDIEGYMDFVSIIGANSETTTLANSDGEYLAHKDFDATTGSCVSKADWKGVTLTFYTDENTTARLAFLYQAAIPTEMYIDDISLIKDVLASPEYFNEDFSNGFNAWHISNSKKITIGNSYGRLKVMPIENFRNVQSSVIKVKKNANYNISFDFDISEISLVYVPLFENGQPVKDANGDYVWETSSSGNPKPNWLNFSLSTKYNAYYPVYTCGSCVFTITDNSGKVYTSNGNGEFGFGKNSTLKDLDTSKSLKMNISFTALDDSEIYLNSRLNGIGNYYLDNFVITEETDNVNFESFVLENAVSTKGTAIRTEGKQGMRHKTKLDKRLLTADMPLGVRLTEYGTVAIKTEDLNDNDLVLDGTYNYNGSMNKARKGVAYSFENRIDLVYAETDTTIDFTGVLINIPEKSYNTDYTVRAYFKYIDKNGKTGTIYLTPNDIAVYPVSKVAYSSRNADNSYVESAEVREYLYENIISKYTDKIINISDKSAPIAYNFQGIRSTVYHGVTFFPDSHGRTYTEKQAAVEMNRLVDSKIDNVRTRFSSKWMWEDGKGWDWNSTKMTAFYKWASMLQDRDISITLNAGWALHDFVYFYDINVATNKVGYKEELEGGHSSIPEVNYLHGYSNENTTPTKVTNLYNEDANATLIEAEGRKLGLNLNDEEFAHYSVAAARYAEWIKQAVNALKAHGIYNVEYILPFTETGYVNQNDPTYCYDEWILMVIALNNAFEKAGVRKNYKFIGPAQAIYANHNRLSLIEYVYSKISGTEYSDILDINAMHAYAKPNTQKGYKDSIYEPYASYSLAEENYSYYDSVLTASGIRNMEFWCDEYFANASDIRHWEDVGMQGTQFAAGLVAGMNNGINRFITWQMFDTLWDSDVSYGEGNVNRSDEFIGGVHAVGTCPSLVFVDGKSCPKGEDCDCNNYTYSSYVPRVTYYGINLIGKFLNNDNAIVYNSEVIDEATQDGGGVYVGAIKNDAGKLVVLVVNTMPTTSSVDVNIEKIVEKGFDRYVYNPNEIVPTEQAKSITSDKTILLDNTKSFTDIIPAQSFAIYVESGNLTSEDTEIPF